MAANKKDDKIVIRKYANRRLYDTSTSTYVTMEHLADMVRKGIDFVVLDAKSGDDITHSVLTQIIAEEETKGNALLPVNFLKQLISMYGSGLQIMLPQYLEQTIETFNANREKMKEMMTGAMGGVFPINAMQDIGRQNMEAMEKTMRMLTQMPKPQTEQSDSKLYEAVTNLQRQISELSQVVHSMADKKR